MHCSRPGLSALNDYMKNCHTALDAEVFARRRQVTVDDYDDDKDGDVPRDHHTTSGDVTRALVA